MCSLLVGLAIGYFFFKRTKTPQSPELCCNLTLQESNGASKREAEMQTQPQGETDSNFFPLVNPVRADSDFERDFYAGKEANKDVEASKEVEELLSSEERETNSCSNTLRCANK